MRVGLALVASLTATAPALAETTVVELFTSQSCYSCPPAEAYLGELADRPDLVALEWHVDYWDDLVYGSSGRWADPFSDPAFSERQRVYNRAIRGRSGGYTPQMVIDGRLEAAGSRRGAVEAAIARAATAPDLVSLTVSRTDEGGLAIAVEGTAPSAADVWLVHLLDRRVTDVLGGENDGKTLANHNIVVGLERVGPWTTGSAPLTVPALTGQGDGCAILVQAANQGEILAAAYCP